MSRQIKTLEVLEGQGLRDIRCCAVSENKGDVDF